MKEKIIQKLSTFIFEIEEITEIREDNEEIINGWKSSVSIFLSGIFGQDSIEVNEIKNMKLDSELVRIDYNSFEREYFLIPFKENAKKIIYSIINKIEILGIPEKSKPNSNSGINIVNQNNLSQTQNVEINIILETIKDELPPKAMREIEEIVKSNEPEKSKKNKVIEIIKNLGMEVASSTLAKIVEHTMGM